MPRKHANIQGAILCGCGEPADFATFFFNGDETEVSCAKCHVIAVLAMMEHVNEQAEAEAAAATEGGALIPVG